MIRSILVPLDGSAFGEHALPLAAWLARRAPARLQLVHVHHSMPATDFAGIPIMDDLELSIRKEETAYLDRMVRRLKEEADVPASTVLLHGDVATAIHDRATAENTDLVVLSTHGRGALGRFWLGNVADELVRRLPMPVLMVRPTEQAMDLGEPPVIQHILLPLDGTALAEQILEPVIDLAELLAARLTLVRIIHPVIRVEYLPEGRALEAMTSNLLEEIEACQKQLHAEAQNYLDGVARRLTSSGLKVETQVEVEDQPAVGILRTAKSIGADLIAMETHGRRGLSRFFLGSVADKVLRGGHLPVLLHRPVHV